MARIRFRRGVMCAVLPRERPRPVAGEPAPCRLQPPSPRRPIPLGDAAGRWRGLVAAGPSGERGQGQPLPSVVVEVVR